MADNPLQRGFDDAASRPVVFLGLSLREEEACEILPAEYRGPVRKGDLDAISAPATVVIVDGVLDDDERLPVSEASSALRRGVELYGTSSTGALLAVKLAEVGMKGFGRVFDFLRRSSGDRENLVAALYVPPENQPLTVPLISIILACRDAGFDSAQLDALMQALVSIPLAERTWETIESTLSEAGFHLPETVRASDAKKADARALLALLREGGQPLFAAKHSATIGNAPDSAACRS